MCQFSRMAVPRKACDRLLLGLVALALPGVARTGNPFAKAQCQVFEAFSSKRRANFFIAVLFSISIGAIFVLWIYMRVTDHRYLRKSKKMERVRRAEEIVVAILKNFSLESVHDFHFRGIMPKINTIAVEFENLRITVHPGRSIFNGWHEVPEKTLLAGVTGEFRPCRMAAIMGPSGAGKTTLLNVLCGKVKSGGGWKVEGRIYINNELKDISSLKPIMGFVPQDDIVHEGMTVRENIRFSAEMRNPAGTDRKALNRITEDVLKVLQLEAQQNIVVGNRAQGAGGLSGGQRKRVNIGLELAACPTLLFLDEPTSGLDATTSLLLAEMLKKMTGLGMTIIMVIHQPRYSLFTLIDDVLLLGRGGRTAFIGPTADAKRYLESLGFSMPVNENPSDWMMDILSGQNLAKENSKMLTKTLPGALFEAWASKEWASKESGHHLNETSKPRRGSLQKFMTSQEEDRGIDVIRSHVKEEWKKFVAEGKGLEIEEFLAFLEHCLGCHMDENYSIIIAEELMQNVKGVGDDEDTEITENEFVEYLLKFRRDNRRGSAVEAETLIDELMTSEFSDSDSSESASCRSQRDLEIVNNKNLLKKNLDISRKQPGFFTHLRVVMHRNMVQWWRRMTIRVLFVLVVEFAAVFLGLFDAMIFHSPPWMPTVLLNTHVSVALLVSVYSLSCFSRDQPMYWREASHGLNRFAFMCARMIVDTIDVFLIVFYFTATYYIITTPELNFEVYIVPFMLVGLVASGWGYLISSILPPILAPFCAAVLCFMMGGILGLPDKMKVFLNGGILEGVVDTLCFTRWSVPMDFMAYEWCGHLNISQYDDIVIQRQFAMYKEGYEQTHWQLDWGPKSPWYTGAIYLLGVSTALRFATYPALRWVNAHQQL